MAKIKKNNVFYNKWLQFYIMDRNANVEDIIAALGITRVSWNNKRSKRTSWYWHEVITVKRFLKLTDEEFNNVFPSDF